LRSWMACSRHSRRAVRVHSRHHPPKRLSGEIRACPWRITKAKWRAGSAKPSPGIGRRAIFYVIVIGSSVTSPLGHHLFQVPIAERIAQIPTKAEDDDLVLKVSPAKQCRPLVLHSLTLPECTQLVCDRSLRLPFLICRYSSSSVCSIKGPPCIAFRAQKVPAISRLTAI
jgi:hypothetical protein